MEDTLDQNDIIIVDPSQIDCFGALDSSEAKPFYAGARRKLLEIRKMLEVAPAFINTVKACFPEHTLQAVLSDEQKQKIADGIIKFVVRKKDGEMIGTLVSTVDGQFDSQVALRDVTSVPNLSQALVSFQAQMQMAQIAKQITEIQSIIEDIRRGQEQDRLATAFSCRQKLLQATLLTNPAIKQDALLRIAFDAEDSRNLLMQSQSSTITALMQEPDTVLGKFFRGSSNEKIKQRLDELRDNLEAVNMVSLLQAMAYQEMGETEAAKQGLTYYADFIKTTYLSKPEWLDRLDLIDPSPINYWSELLPDIQQKIYALPYMDSAPYLLESGE